MNRENLFFFFLQRVSDTRYISHIPGKAHAQEELVNTSQTTCFLMTFSDACVFVFEREKEHELGLGKSEKSWWERKNMIKRIKFIKE